MVYEQVATLSINGGDSRLIVPSHSSTFDKTSFMLNDSRKTEKDKYENEKSKYGAWGSMFKDQKHFTDMHHC